jgi:hypothetical protein
MPRRRDAADRAEASTVVRAFAAREAETTAASARLERKILEELIYERVRVAVDMCRLMEFELDLASSIERALSACAESPSERSDLTLDFIQRAWERVTEEVLGQLAEGEVCLADAFAAGDRVGDDAPA